MTGCHALSTLATSVFALKLCCAHFLKRVEAYVGVVGIFAVVSEVFVPQLAVTTAIFTSPC